MNSQSKNVSLLILALVISVLVLIVMVYFLVASLLSPRNQSENQNGNELKIPDLLQDQNPDPDIADFVLDVQSGKTTFLCDQQTETVGYNGSYLGLVIFRQAII